MELHQHEQQAEKPLTERQLIEEQQIQNFCNGISDDLTMEGMFAGCPDSDILSIEIVMPPHFSDRHPLLSSAMSKIEIGTEKIVDILGVKTSAAIALSGVAYFILHNRK